MRYLNLFVAILTAAIAVFALGMWNPPVAAMMAGLSALNFALWITGKARP